MEQDELIKKIEEITKESMSGGTSVAVHAKACELLRTYAGPNSAFLESAKRYNPREMNDDYARTNIRSVLNAYVGYLKAGLSGGISPQQKAQLDVVSDFLEMAQSLLQSKDVHPAAAAVLVGASLEEFLRTWVEAAGLTLGARKAGLEAYSQVLRESELITKQDGKDITSWAGIRNHAAHGEWDEVSDRGRIGIMLEGVNLFMRKYGARELATG